MGNKDHPKASNTLSMYPPSSGAEPSSANPPPYANPGQAPPFTAPPSGQYPGQYPPYPAPGGQPYYTPLQQPGAPYGAPYPNGQQQQQQQQVVVMGAQPMMPTAVVVNHPSYVSFSGAIALSCIVYFFCGWLFGGIAFILAIVGQSSAESGDTRSAIQMRNASYGLSITGIIIGVIAIAVVAGVLGSATNKAIYHSYTYNSHYTKYCYAYSRSGAYYYTYVYEC